MSRWTVIQSTKTPTSASMDYDDDIDNADDKYRESSDEDFNPDAAPTQDVSSSEDDSDDNITSKPTPRHGKQKGKGKGKGKNKRQAPAEEELDSGDELTIQAARKSRARKQQKAASDDSDADLILSDDQDGEGGLIKTRAQRRAEKKERKPLARTDGATVDVDALWAQMTAAPLKPFAGPAADEQKPSSHQTTAVEPTPLPTDEEEQVAVKKVYTFAGQDTTEEKQIPRSQLDKYLKDGWKALDDAEKPVETTKDAEAEKATKSRVRRPLRRPSRFDPNPTGFVRALAPEHQLSWPRKTFVQQAEQQENLPTQAARAKTEKTHKLNVVDKSRLDWTGFVHTEGIAEELDTHGKTKEAYLGRMDFLAGVEARREEERRNMKVKTTTATLS